MRYKSKQLAANSTMIDNLLVGIPDRRKLKVSDAENVSRGQPSVGEHFCGPSTQTSGQLARMKLPGMRENARIPPMTSWRVSESTRERMRRGNPKTTQDGFLQRPLRRVGRHYFDGERAAHWTNRYGFRRGLIGIIGHQPRPLRTPPRTHLFIIN